MHRHPRTIIAACFVALLATGCHHSASIPPTELPALNGSYERQVGSHTQTTYQSSAVGGQRYPVTRTSPIVERSVRHLVTTSGRTVEVEGEVEVTVVPVGAQPRTFEHPVVSRISPDGILEVRGANRGPAEIPLRNVERVDVRWDNPVGTTLAVTGVSVAITAVALGVFFAVQ